MKKVLGLVLALAMLLSCASALAADSVTLTYAEVNPLDGTIVGAKAVSKDGEEIEISCKAAIKAGWQTEPQELLKLAEAVLSGQVKYCPHGRPVAVTMTRKELDKLFLRIV